MCVVRPTFELNSAKFGKGQALISSGSEIIQVDLSQMLIAFGI